VSIKCLLFFIVIFFFGLAFLFAELGGEGGDALLAGEGYLGVALGAFEILVAEEMLGGVDIAGGVQGVGSCGVAQIVGAAQGDVMGLGGTDEAAADAGEGVAGVGVGEDVSAFFMMGLEQVQGFRGHDAIAGDSGFGGFDEAATIFGAQVVPLQVAGFVEA